MQTVRLPSAQPDATWTGLIVNDVQQPGEIAAAKWLDIGGKDEQGNPYQRQHKNHVLETAYNTLTPSRQKLMGADRLLAQPCEVRVVEGIGGDGKRLTHLAKAGRQRDLY